MTILTRSKKALKLLQSAKPRQWKLKVPWFPAQNSVSAVRGCMLTSETENPILPRPQAAETIQFGSFKVNLATGELFREGRKLQLSGQPAQVLVVLLERAGHLVTR